LFPNVFLGSNFAGVTQIGINSQNFSSYSKKVLTSEVNDVVKLPTAGHISQNRSSLTGIADDLGADGRTRCAPKFVSKQVLKDGIALRIAAGEFEENDTRLDKTSSR
jgi:hypothetical protein